MSGGIAGRGRPGPAGPAGPMGPQGPQGEPAFTLAIGEVSAVPYGQEPAVTNVGTDQDQVWDLALVTGATGVLTGAAPPTGSDGTSLGQLYFCTTNRMYYGLVELSENNNKWSPIMTNASNQIEMQLDMALLRANPPTQASDYHWFEVHVAFDEVRQVLTVAGNGQVAVPIGAGTSYICASGEAIARLRAFAVARGISQIPIPYYEVVNGVTTAKTFNLLGSGPYGAGLAVLDTAPDGEKPGTTVYFHDGKLEYVDNTTGAPGGSIYGKGPSRPSSSDRKVMLMVSISQDSEYIKTLNLSFGISVPYE